ncbi:chromosomal replication initiator protein DnaA [Bifidobacterium dolichotidis]|uniref:Chromosomal replication initiator protein DnaA n=1 Tax=Bifidobacterium dolichotidis TaxID=2306976 RepID=A0A430FNY7_9BIFI|nr:chromosomal replication initiator protein DnaA [Bifidobacterium dolichotidis]RSX54536.1 chromosomal replication initiator protein DnaA [Bifidobacterium dolichotidis]
MGTTITPTDQAAQVWSNALLLIRQNKGLTARQKGWLEGVIPEAIYGTTMVLCVDNASTLQIMQTELMHPLLEALTLANGGVTLFPAFKLLPEEDKKSTNPSSAPVAAAEPEEPAEPAAPATPGAPAAPVASATSAAASAMPTAEPKFGEAAPASLPTEPAVAATLPMTDVPVTPVMPAAQPMVPQAAMPTAAMPAAMPTAVPMQPAPAMAQPAMPEYSSVTQGQLPIPTNMPEQHIQRGTSQPQLDPDTHLNKNATFDNFVPGDSNQFARTVALAVAEGSGRDYNPLCIYGGSGLGKTHLLNAIGNYALVKDPSLKVRYVTTEEFTNEFIESIRPEGSDAKPMSEFNHRYRSVDVLLIDDIQFLSGKSQTMEQFFHTFNTLQQANKRIVIASDVAPKKLKDFEDRLISRFESGLVVDVKPPKLETRIAILRMMAETNGVTVPRDVLDMIAEHCTENIRQLEGALTRVTAQATLNSQPITRALAEQVLKDYNTNVEVKPTDIMGQVAKYFHLTFDDLVGRSRTKNVALARQIAMYLTREMTSMSLVDIGQVFGGRDHTTVMHNCDRISSEMGSKQEIYNYVMELTVRLKQPTGE